MFKLFGNKRLIIALIGVILFIVLAGLTLEQRKNLTWSEKFLKDSTSFFQSLFYKPAGLIAGFFEDLQDLSIIYEENEAIKQKLTQYARDTARLNALEIENRELKEALEFTDKQKQSNNYIWHIAEVTSMSPDPLNSSIQIDIGEKHGIRNNMAVTTVDGLIGIVSQVSPFSSTVQLITDINYQMKNTKAIAATVFSRDQSFGMIEAYDRPNNRFIMTKIQEADQLEEGDVVVTSGIGRVFPKGIVIGTVESREVGEFGITHNAVIKPAANFEHLRQVFVVELPE